MIKYAQGAVRAAERIARIDWIQTGKTEYDKLKHETIIDIIDQETAAELDRLRGFNDVLLNALKTVQGCNHEGKGKCPSCDSFIRAALAKEPESGEKEKK